MTSATWYHARFWRMRSAEMRALADNKREVADDYDLLAEWAGKVYQDPSFAKHQRGQIADAR
jgi:hypothetical protein